MVKPTSDGHGDVFASGLGAMIVHVQREHSVAHRTFILNPWQVRLVRAASHRGVRVLAGLVLLSWGYFAIEAARVPLLTAQLAQMEHDALRLDTLEQTLGQLQARYEQVQAMLSAPPAASVKAGRNNVVPHQDTDGSAPPALGVLR